MTSNKVYGKKNRAVVLILDGLGIGELPDVKTSRPQDSGAFTLKHVIQGRKSSCLKNFIKCGLGNCSPESDLPLNPNPLMNYGKNKFMHFGADTFWGHQEIVGTKPRKPVTEHVIEIADNIKKNLEEDGHLVRYYNNNKSIIIVDEKVVIGDNLEADPGWVISVTGLLDEIEFNEVLKVGKAVRKIAKTSRVNVHGGKFVDMEGLLAGVEERIDEGGKKFVGHNVPKTGIYPSPHFRQIQLGYGVNPENQITSTLTRNGFPVFLIGKVGDVITCNGAFRKVAVQTSDVIKFAKDALKNKKNGLFMVNIQETDLSGHIQNAEKYFKTLIKVDKALPEIINLLNKGDLFIITADHGNDPSLHSRHTREYTPLLAWIKGGSKNNINLGTRETLSDIASTIAEFFGVSLPENGESFLKEIK